MSTRFTDATWKENNIYKERHDFKGCIYGSPQQLSAKIPQNALLYVIEMNNSQNKIIGIGCLNNVIEYSKYYQVYDTGNYNRYVLKGKCRLNRSEIPPHIVEVLDHILFKEKTHMKRGSGMTCIPTKLLKHPKVGDMNIKHEIEQLFVRRGGESAMPLCESAMPLCESAMPLCD